MNERLRFNTKQAAEYAGKHPMTILRACESGELHGGQRLNKDTGLPKKGGHWSIRRECLDAWLDGAKCGHQEVAA